ELLQTLRVAVQGIEEVAPVLGLILRLARPQAFGEVGPETKETGAHHLQHATQVRRLGAIQVQVGRRRIGILALLALEHAQSNQGVEKIARAALVKLEPGPNLLQRQRPPGQRGKESQFHRAEQRLGTPVAKAQLHDRIGRDFLSHPGPPRITLSSSCSTSNNSGRRPIAMLWPILRADLAPPSAPAAT